MPNILQKLIYNLSTVAPICFAFAIVWGIQEKSFYVPLACCLVGLLLIVLFYKSFAYGRCNLASIDIRTENIEPSDGWIVLYVITYIFPFTSLVIKDLNLVVLSIFMVLLAVAAPFVNTAIPNPLLFIKKYHFYKINTKNGISYVLISKKKYRHKQQLKQVYRVFDFLLLDVEREK